MQVLFLGNSYTFFNDLPTMTAALAASASIPLTTDSVTRGGAYLHQFADPGDELYERWQTVYQSQKWDAVVLQNQSFHPVKDPAAYRQAAADVQALLKPGQKIFLYETWAYKDGSTKLAGTGLTYADMYHQMAASCMAVGKSIGAAIVPVGEAFAHIHDLHPEIELYNPDGSHPSPAGTYLAACLFTATLTGHSPLYLEAIPAVEEEICDILRSAADWILTDVPCGIA